MNKNFVSIKWEEWDKTYQPETKEGQIIYFDWSKKEDVEYLKSIDPRRIWTHVQTDSGDVIVSGYCVCNRITIHVTKIPVPKDTDVEVTFN